MAISSFSKIMKIFGSDPTEEEQREIFHEAALMTLARATSADTNVKAVEIQTVQDVMRRVCDAQVSDSDIRVAARSELYERAPLFKYLTAVAPHLDTDQRVAIVNALAEVIKADVRISPAEAEFFDHVAEALTIRPSDLVGLYSDEDES